MKKTVIVKSFGFYGTDGAIGSATVFELENEKYVIPETVKIRLNGRELHPTSFDEHGNPRIDGIANWMFTWNKQLMVMDGLIDNLYSDLEVECEYEDTPEYYRVNISDRIAKMDVCPVCGEKFKLSELHNNLESYENALFHKNCLKEFKKLQMINEISSRVKSGLSDRQDSLEWQKDIKYKLIPNEYCSKPCCEHRPWFLFDTPYGGVKVGWRKRVISITFLKDFMTVDFDKVFDKEDVTKYREDNTYTIHAWGYEKLYEYLRMVIEEIKETNLK